MDLLPGVPGMGLIPGRFINVSITQVPGEDYIKIRRNTKTDGRLEE